MKSSFEAGRVPVVSGVLLERQGRLGRLFVDFLKHRPFIRVIAATEP